MAVDLSQMRVCAPPLLADLVPNPAGVGADSSEGRRSSQASKIVIADPWSHSRKQLAEGMRACSSCNSPKPQDAFPVKNPITGTRGSICLSCHRRYHRQWYLRNRDSVIARVRANRLGTRQPRPPRIDIERRRRRWLYLLDHPCVDCGESDPIVLEFDHRSEKRARIAFLMRWHAPWDEIRAEIEKCEVRCANCHRRRTARQRRYYRDIMQSSGTNEGEGEAR